jgi:hypothetical protein
MGEVIAFPDVRLSDLAADRPKDKTLIVEPVGKRRARVRMHPILSDREKLVRLSFDTVEVARAYANRIHRQWPELYSRIDDRTRGAA